MAVALRDSHALRLVDETEPEGTRDRMGPRRGVHPTFRALDVVVHRLGAEIEDHGGLGIGFAGGGPRQAFDLTQGERLQFARVGPLQAREVPERWLCTTSDINVSACRASSVSADIVPMETSPPWPLVVWIGTRRPSVTPLASRSL